MFLHKKDMDRTRLHRERKTKGDFYIPVPSQTLFPEEGRGYNKSFSYMQFFHLNVPFSTSGQSVSVHLHSLNYDLK